MVNSSDILFTNHLRVLDMIYDYQVEIDNTNFSKITQVEISEKLGISKVTVNHIMKELAEAGFVRKEDKKIGKYYLSKETQEIVKKIKTIR